MVTDQDVYNAQPGRLPLARLELDAARRGAVVSLGWWLVILAAVWIATPTFGRRR